MKNEVQPIQEAEAARIRSEVAVFTTKVADYGKTFRTRSFYKYATGAAKAYPEIDQVRGSLPATSMVRSEHTSIVLQLHLKRYSCMTQIQCSKQQQPKLASAGTAGSMICT